MLSVSISLLVTSYLVIIASGNGNVPFADQSFRSLQSGENSEEIVNQCCRRESKYETIGYGMDDLQFRVDVGSCRQVCEKPPLQPLRREEFDKYLEKYPSMDPIQIFLALQSRIVPKESAINNTTSSSEDDDDGGGEALPLNPSMSMSMSASTATSCLHSSCHPTATRREVHFAPDGTLHTLDVVESCDCLRLPQSCQRISNPVKLHGGTPYEKVVELGSCSGQCGHGGGDETGSSCQPVRNRSINLEGPNGSECMQVVEECGCVGACYRVKEFFKVFDYSIVFSSKGNDSISSTTTKDPLEDNVIGGQIPLEESSSSMNVSPLPPTEPLIKMIDVGRCEGKCQNHHRLSSSSPHHHHNHHHSNARCLLRSPSGRCVSELYGGTSASCSPSKFMTHTYTDKIGQVHSVFSVLSCGCR